MNLDKLRRQRVSACPIARHIAGITMVKEQGEIQNNPEVNDEEGESEKDDNEYNT